MTTAIEERLDVLRGEYERGQRHLELLDCQRQELRDRLLRIGGAIQVLEELLAPEPAVQDQVYQSSRLRTLDNVARGFTEVLPDDDR